MPSIKAEATGSGVTIKLHDMRPVSSWSTVWLLLTAAGRRAKGRRWRQIQLWKQRSGRKGLNLGRLAPVLGFLITLAVQMMFIIGMVMVVQKGQVADQ